MEFDRLEEVESTKEVIKEVFDVDLDISGGWGYDKESAVIVHSLKIEKDQFINMLATIRANIEMNLVLEEGKRYSGINVQPQELNEITVENRTYDVVSVKVMGMNEKAYADFIQEYKDNYGKKDFDLTDHFDRRKEETLERVVDIWVHWDLD